MAKNKTTETSISVSAFINAVNDEAKRNDSFALIEIIKKQTGLHLKCGDRALLDLEAIITNMIMDMKAIAHLLDFRQGLLH